MLKTNTRQVATYWNKRGKTYSRSWTSLAKRRLSTMETDLVANTLKNLQEINKAPIKALDIGIAIGRICEQILKYDVELYGTDISQTMVDICKDKFSKNRKAKRFSIHDIHDPIPLSWGKFDLVTAFRVLAYSPHWKKEFNNIYNAMKPGGILIFTFPNRYSTHMISTKMIRRPLDGSSISLDELKNLVKDTGFSNVKIFGYNRLLDSFYDWADDEVSSNVIFAIENILTKILGPTLFVRLFYVICRKK